MNNFDDLNISTYRYGGTEEQPFVGVSGGYYTPYFLANFSSQSGSPNINAYLALLKQLNENISISAGGVAGANKYYNYLSPVGSLNYNNGGFNAGINYQQSMPSQFYMQYQKRF